MRKINLRLLASSVKPGVVGDGGEVAKSGDGRQKGGVQFAVARASLDAWLGQKKEGIEAHLLGLTVGLETAPIGGDDGRPAQLGFPKFGRFGRRGENLWLLCALYPSCVRWRSATAATTSGRGDCRLGGELSRVQSWRRRRRRCLRSYPGEGLSGLCGLRLGPWCWAVRVGYSVGCPAR
jgi:hypothetical protein